MQIVLDPVSDNDAERSRRYRDRLAGIAPPIEGCVSCGRRVYNQERKLCRHCWRKSPEGIAYVRESVAASRAKAREAAFRETMAASRTRQQKPLPEASQQQATPENVPSASSP
jgi:recombinational DNA repair protein (RecF pathway)